MRAEHINSKCCITGAYFVAYTCLFPVVLLPLMRSAAARSSATSSSLLNRPPYSSFKSSMVFSQENRTLYTMPSCTRLPQRPSSTRARRKMLFRVKSRASSGKLVTMDATMRTSRLERRYSGECACGRGDATASNASLSWLDFSSMAARCRMLTTLSPP